jgi:hypothetical protein
MSIYDESKLLTLTESDGADTDYLSLFEGIVPDFRNIKTYKYKVQEGDRIDRIAKALLGSTEYWKYIMLVNPKYMEPSEIVAGDIIQIPEIRNTE